MIRLVRIFAARFCIGIAIAGLTACLTTAEEPCRFQDDPLSYCADKVSHTAWCTTNFCPGVKRVDHGCVDQDLLAKAGINAANACIFSSFDNLMEKTGSPAETDNSSSSLSFDSDGPSTTASHDASEWSDASSDTSSESATHSDQECIVDSDCNGDPNASLCNPGTGKCVQCLTPESTQGCDPAANKVCNEANTCVACTSDQHCSGQFDACLVDLLDSRNNACVDCLENKHCPQSTPICQANACQACTAVDGDILAQCRTAEGLPAACVTASPGNNPSFPQVGECLNDFVLYVGGPDSCTDANEGGKSVEKPLCTLKEALRRVQDPQNGGRVTILIEPGLTLGESVAIDSARVAIVPDPNRFTHRVDPRPILRGTDALAASLAIHGGAFVIVNNLDIREGLGAAIACDGGGTGNSLVLLNSTLRKNAGRSMILTNKCNAVAHNVEISWHQAQVEKESWVGGGTIVVDDSFLKLTNALVSTNATVFDKGGIEARSGANVELNFVTLNYFQVPASFNLLPGLYTEGDESRIAARNTFIQVYGSVLQSKSTDCPASRCSIENSVTDDQSLATVHQGGTLAYVENLKDTLDLETLRLRPNSAIHMIIEASALWQNGDPTTDLDGKVRPLNAQQRTYPGASVP